MSGAAKPKQYRKRERESDSEDEGSKTQAASRAVRPQAALNTFSVPKSTTTKPDDSGVLQDRAYTASGTGASHAYGGGAFSYNETDTSADRDARAQLEKKLALQAQAVTDLEAGRKVYRGQAGYTNFYMKDSVEAVARAKASGTLGPARGPSNVRGITLVDYKPDICKDYKETGQCPFGDSCIFLHDRSDYKSGWQLELEWQALQKKKADRLAARLAAGGTVDDEDDEQDEKIDLYKKKLPGTQWVDPLKAAKAAGKQAQEEELPFACFICRGGFKPPVVQTQCGHYFCESCAVERHRKTPFCAVCNKQTHGIFNAAPKLLAKLRAAGKLPEADEDGHGAGSGTGASSSAAAGGRDGIQIGEGSRTPSEAGDSDDEGAGGGWTTADMPSKPSASGQRHGPTKGSSSSAAQGSGAGAIGDGPGSIGYVPAHMSQPPDDVGTWTNV